VAPWQHTQVDKKAQRRVEDFVSKWTGGDVTGDKDGDAFKSTSLYYHCHYCSKGQKDDLLKCGGCKVAQYARSSAPFILQQGNGADLAHTLTKSRCIALTPWVP